MDNRTRAREYEVDIIDAADIGLLVRDRETGIAVVGSRLELERIGRERLESACRKMLRRRATALLDSVRREAVDEALGSAMLAIGTLKIMAYEAGDTTAWRYLDDAMARIRALATPTKPVDETK